METKDQTEARDFLVNGIIDSFNELSKLRKKTTAAEWMNLQLTLPQFKLLVVISQSEFSNVGSIAEYLGIGESTASYLVERLVQAGLVERTDDPADRRKAKICLSPEGKALIDKLIHTRNWFDDRLQYINMEDLEALHRGLKAILTTEK